MSLNDALYGFAAAGLDKAGGTNLLGGAIDAAREKDRLANQIRQAEMARARARKEDDERSRGSRRGLVDALQKVGGLRSEDVISAGGVDALASLGDDEFGIAMSQLQENRVRSAGLAEQRQILTGQLAAHGIATDADLATVEGMAEAASLIQIRQLEETQRRGQRKEAGNAANQAITQLESDLNRIFQDPTRIDTGSLQRAFGLHNTIGARVAAAAGEMDEADYANSIQRLNSNADWIREQAPNAELNRAAGGPVADILTTYSNLDPARRDQFLQRRNASQVVGQVEATAAALISLSPEEAEKLGVAALQKRVEASGGPRDAATDAALAQELYAAAPTMVHAETRLAEMAKQQAVTAKAQQTASAMRAVLGARMDPAVDANSFVHDGYFDETGFGATALAPLIASIPTMEPSELREARRQLQKTGLDQSLIAAPAAAIDNRLNEFAASMSPVERLGAMADDESAVLRGIGPVMEIPPLVVTTKKPPSWVSTADDQLDQYSRKVLGVNPAWATAMAGVVNDHEELLVTQRNDLKQSATQAQNRAAEFADDPALDRSFKLFADQEIDAYLQAETRLDARELVRGSLGSLNLGEESSEIAKALFKMAGGKDEEAAAGVPAIEAGLGSAEGLLAQVESVAYGGLDAKSQTPEMKRALNAELTALLDMTKQIAPMFQGEDRDRTMAALARSGILTSAQSEFPELEVLAYFLSR